jgi:hypothetical protein
MSSKRRVLEDHARMFGILLPQYHASRTFSDEAKAIMHDRLVAAERELAYLDLMEGHNENARRRLIALIRRAPLKVDLYVALAKACVPGVGTAGMRAMTQTHDNTKDANT